jgi:hypothetical protein
MKFIPLQTFARASLENREYTFTKIPKCSISNYNYAQCIFEVKEGVPGMAQKRGKDSNLNPRTKIGPWRCAPLHQMFYEHPADFANMLSLSVRGPGMFISVKTDIHSDYNKVKFPGRLRPGS